MGEIRRWGNLGESHTLPESGVPNDNGGGVSDSGVRRVTASDSDGAKAVFDLWMLFFEGRSRDIHISNSPKSKRQKSHEEDQENYEGNLSDGEKESVEKDLQWAQSERGKPAADVLVRWKDTNPSGVLLARSILLR
ncbi:hypothetical protein DMENIID0001_107840 [Sergentomyia squamirostris]